MAILRLTITSIAHSLGSLAVTCTDEKGNEVKLELNMDNGTGLAPEIKRKLDDPANVYENARI